MKTPRRWFGFFMGFLTDVFGKKAGDWVKSWLRPKPKPKRPKDEPLPVTIEEIVLCGIIDAVGFPYYVENALRLCLIFPLQLPGLPNWIGRIVSYGHYGFDQNGPFYESVDLWNQSQLDQTWLNIIATDYARRLMEVALGLPSRAFPLRLSFDLCEKAWVIGIFLASSRLAIVPIDDRFQTQLVFDLGVDQMEMLNILRARLCSNFGLNSEKVLMRSQSIVIYDAFSIAQFLEKTISFLKKETSFFEFRKSQEFSTMVRLYGELFQGLKKDNFRYNENSEAMVSTLNQKQALLFKRFYG